jgi:hypothetical protein
MSPIYTCELNGVNPFDYLTELERHADRVAASPRDWMPWNYRSTLDSVYTPISESSCEACSADGTDHVEVSQPLK